MPHRATLVYSEALVRRAVWRYWRRTVGVGFLVALGLVSVSLVVLLYSGDRSWVVGVLACVLLMGVFFVFAIYFVHLADGLKKLKAMGRPEAIFIADEEFFSIDSAGGQATLPWRAVVEVWQFPEFWLLLFSRAQFITLPLNCVPADMQMYIADRAVGHGSRISATH